MILLLNGSFGIGKSTVAAALRKRVPGSVVFDPEWVGSALQRVVRPRPDDYQDLAAWRRLTIAGIGLARRLRPTVIVPMAFTNLDYLAEIARGAERVDPEVRRLCLVAPLEVVLDRIARRAAAERTGPEPWVLRRAAQCCGVHGRGGYGEPVEAASRSADEIAADIAGRLRSAGLPG